MKHLMVALVLILAPTTAWCQLADEVEAEDYDGTEIMRAERAAKQALWSDLRASRVAGDEKGHIVMSIDPVDKQMLDADPTGSAQQVVGVHLPVNLSFSMSQEMAYLTDKSATPGLGRAAVDAMGGSVWTASMQVEGATALRVHFTNVQLPPGAALYLYNDAGQAHGPYTGQGPHGSGEFWSHTVFGEYVWIQLHTLQSDAATRAKMSFDIASVSHLGERFELAKRAGQAASKADCSANLDCVENAECYDWDDILSSARKGVALFLFENPGSTTTSQCSGGLLNDQDSSGRTPWFLTANHCINNESAADSLEAFFQYQSSCGSCDGSYVDSVLGSDLWATSSGADFSLLELSELPSDWTLMGWSTADVMDSAGLQLYRISHPSGSPQSFSQHEVVLSAYSRYIATRNAIGTIQRGSSGSPVFRDDRKVVGQLSGYTDGTDLCDPTTFLNGDGALSYYWKSVRPYLSSPSNTNKMHLSGVAAGTKKISFLGVKFFYGKATVTVVDELGNVVPFATVTGSFSSGLSGTYSGTTNHNGQATILHPAFQNNKPNFTFCVTDVTQPYFNTYDEAANDVTCASR